MTQLELAAAAAESTGSDCEPVDDRPTNLNTSTVPAPSRTLTRPAHAFTLQSREPTAPSPLRPFTPATDPSAHGESDSEDESADLSTSMVNEPSRAPSGTPLPADEGSDAEVAELVASVQELVIAQPHSLGDPIEAPAAPTPNLSVTDPDSFLREIVVTKKYPVLFLGESLTRALPLAIGAMRGSLQGIWSTCYHHSEDTTPCHWHARDAVKVHKVIEDMRDRIGRKSNRDLLQRKGAYMTTKLEIFC